MGIVRKTNYLMEEHHIEISLKNGRLASEFNEYFYLSIFIYTSYLSIFRTNNQTNYDITRGHELIF